MLGFPTVAPINSCLKGFFQKSFQKGERCPFSLFERKRTKKKQTSVPLDRLSNVGRITQSPMKLRVLRSSALCWNQYPVRAFASRRCADRASDSPTPSSFPSFICLQIPCSFFYGTSLLNKNLFQKVNAVALKISGLV